MRVLNYPFNANKAQLVDSYNHIWGEFMLTNGANTLPLTNREFQTRDSFGNVFYIYDGEGDLQWSEAIKRYDLTKLPSEILDFYLLTQSPHPHSNAFYQAKINEFLEIYELNIAKGYEYLRPFGFSELENELLRGHKCETMI